MKIERKQLLTEMIEFTQAESGVIVGDPGVGKSYLLSEMVDALLEQNIPASMVRMDFLSEGSDAEIAESMGVPGTNWVDPLKRIMLPGGKKGVLIFDSYDSIRDEKLKTVLLGQIAKAKRELPGWSIVVSVRTYDAARSQKLIDLFPKEFNSDNIHCRRLTIPILSEEELKKFLVENEQLSVVYEGGNQKLKDVLRIPFFLSLLDIILRKTDASTDTLKTLRSEIELLEMYWVKVVYKVTPSIQTELFLRKMTVKMVDDRALSVDKLDFLGELRTEEILVAERLLSENLLTEQGAYTTRIGYAHNILFDYAVSKLVLKDNATALVAFIKKDPARPFFLRPSFVYFFGRLWYTDQPKFWSIYNELSQSSDNVISLFNKLIPSSVIAKEFDEKTKLEILDGVGACRPVQVINILQSLRFLKETTNQAAQASLLFQLSTSLQLEFAVDFTILLERLIDTPEIKANPKIFTKCGEAARNLMDFFVARKSNPQVDHLAGHRGVPLIAKTYSTEIEASRTRLKDVLDMLTQPNFNIGYFVSLTDNIKEIAVSDPEFCANIYANVFAHEENSSDPTPMHTGVLASFTTNRHDQFNSCHFRLQQFFPTFLKTNPEIAIPLGLGISNDFSSRRAPAGIQIPESITTPFNFSIDGVTAHYKVDISHFWSENRLRTEPVFHTELILEYFDEIIDESELLGTCLKLYIKHSQNAYNWGKLLEFGAKHPKVLHSLLFELLLQPAILFWNDTIVAASSFLEASVPFLRDDQLLQIEKAILAITDYVSEAEKNKADTAIIRLLSRIPRERLKEEKSLSMLTASGKIANDPLFSYESSVEELTTEIFLAEKGVDIKNPDIEELLDENKKMEWLARQFSNHVADRDTYAESLQSAIKTFAAVKKKGQLPPQLVQTLLTNVAAVCDVVLRSELSMREELPLSEEKYSDIKEMILYCLDMHTESDTFAEQNSSPGGGYSSTPRSQAASALVRLFGKTKDVELLPLIKQYADDKNSVTRFGIVQSAYLLYADQNEVFWEIINDRIAKEDDWFTKSVVIGNLDNLKIFSNEPDRFLMAFHLAKGDVVKISGGNNSFLDNFLLVGLAFLRKTGDLRIKDVFQECLEENLSIGPTLIFQAFKIIEPENFYRNYSDETDIKMSQRVIDVLMELLGKCEKILLSVKPGDQLSEEVEQAFKIIDTMIQRIYFSMQVNERIIQRKMIKVTPEHQERFYFFTKPLLEKIISISRQLGDGHMQGHSAHYFIEIMGAALRFDPRFSLATTSEITNMAIGTYYTFDHSAIREVVKFTEKLLADHKVMLTEPEVFSQIMDLLNIYVQSGWPEALELLWRLDDIFR